MAVEYDVAISFAGEDRVIAEQLADLLANEFKLAVFYDDYEQANLWGKFLTEKLMDIYCNKSQFCIVLISEHYKVKRWTKHEWRSAQERAFLEPEKDYLLPIKLDDTLLDGMFQTMGYIDARQNSIRKIARLVFEKVGDFSEILAVVRLADQKYREGLIDEALALIEHPKFDYSIDALRVKGNAFGHKADYICAIRSFDLILKEYPNDFLSHFHVAIYSYRIGDFKRSVEHYEIADKLSPNHPTIQSDLPAARRNLERITTPK